MRVGNAAVLLMLLTACGSDEPGTTAPPTRIEEVPLLETTTIPTLEGAVEVVRDTRGMVHIYGSTLHDIMLAEGYMMAKDRFPEMELVRRNVTGRLAEFGSALDATLLDKDIATRWIGFKRVADEIYAGLSPTSDDRIALDAFSEGVTLFINDLREERADVPRGATVLNFIVTRPEIFDDWHPQDTLAIGRYLSHALSYSGDDEIELTESRDGADSVFTSDHEDPRFVARHRIFADLWNFAPAEHVYSNGVTPAMTTVGHADAPRRQPAYDRSSIFGNARQFMNTLQRVTDVFATSERGSNNWIVSGDKTASGNPILSNDPHLSLSSPPLFWYAHLNTKRAGGDINVAGLALAGTPGIILGYNDSIAWGVTTANHDVTDVYEETITPGESGAPDTVSFNGEQVAIEHVTETIGLSDNTTVDVTFERVPHHGLIVPTIENGMVMPRTDAHALSVRWTGATPSNELGAFLGLNMAHNRAEAEAAIAKFEVGAQNFVVITNDNQMLWSTHARLPVRPAAALNYDPVTGSGDGPMFVLPGDGTCEWAADFAPAADLPQDANPARGYIATANNDPVGTTDDGNPLNDPLYIGWDYDLGHRESRITSELVRLTTRGNVTTEEMSALQGDTRSAVGSRLTPGFLASLAHAFEEMTTPGTHPDLTAAVTQAGANMTKVMAMRDRLEAWTFETPAAVEGSPTQVDVDASVATTIFNTVLVRLVNLSFGDEAAMLPHKPDSQHTMKAMERIFLDVSSMQTYDAGIADTVLFDDITTDEVETRDERVLRAFLSALDKLEMTYGVDMNEWRWGNLHTLRFSSLLPAVGIDMLSIPLPTSMFPNGYPRHGDLYAVDVGNFSPWTDTDNFSPTSGAQQRLVVEMTPEGPRAFNALPGGQILDPDNDHYDDEAQLWRMNMAPAVNYTEAEVLQNYEGRYSFHP